MIYRIVFLLWSFGPASPSFILAFSETPSFKEHPQNLGVFPHGWSVTVPAGITFGPSLPEERDAEVENLQQAQLQAWGMWKCRPVT